MSTLTFPQARAMLARAAYSTYNRNQLVDLLPRRPRRRARAFALVTGHEAGLVAVAIGDLEILCLDISC